MDLTFFRSQYYSSTYIYSLSLVTNADIQIKEKGKEKTLRLYSQIIPFVPVLLQQL